MNRHGTSKTLALAVAAALIPAFAMSGAAQAQDYQFEGGLTYIDLDPDVGRSDSVWGVDVAWYLEPVRTSGLPLAAAAFYTRASNLYASYLTFDKADLDIVNLGGEYYHDRIYLAAEYLRFSNGASSDDFVLGVGYVPVDGLRLAARYLFGDLSDDAFSLDVVYVAPLAGGTALAVGASAAFVDDDEDTKAFDLTADYFFNPAFSVGARFSYIDEDTGSDTGWGLGVKYFFTPTISGELEYFSDDFVDSIGVRLAARF